MKHCAPTIVQGQAGVYRVASELLLRKHIPWMPAVDYGVDLIVDGVLRVQVKTTLDEMTHWRCKGHLTWVLNHGPIFKKGRYLGTKTRQFSEVCDIVILWAIRPKRWFIVPSHVLDGRGTIRVGPVPQWRKITLEQVQSLQASGLTHQAIAEQLGVAASTIRRRLDGSFGQSKRNLANLVDYENRWDLIDQMLGVLTEANRVVERTTPAPVGAESIKV